jgi:hypothetical protein
MHLSSNNKQPPKLRQFIENNLTEIIMNDQGILGSVDDNMENYDNIEVVDDGFSSESNLSPNRVSADSNYKNPALFLDLQKKNLKPAGAYQASLKIKVFFLHLKHF